MNTWKKLLCLALTLVMLLGAFPLTAAAASPTISVSSENVKINMAENKSARVSFSCANAPDGCYFSLAAAGPFVCEWNEDDSFTINATGTGSADLDLMLCRESDDKVLAKKTIHVTVVSEVPVLTVKASTLNEKALAKVNAKYDKQAYAVNKYEYTDTSGTNQTAYKYAYGICDANAYTTLLNRFVAAYYGDSSFSITTGDALKSMGISFNTVYYKKGGATTSDTAVGSYTLDGYKVKKNASTKTKISDILKLYKSSDSGTVRGFALKKVNSTTYPSVGRFFTKASKYPFTYKNGNRTVTIKTFLYYADPKVHTSMTEKPVTTKKADITPSVLAELLSDNPEGLFIHAKRDSKNQHAVLLIACTKPTPQSYRFTVLDPAKGKYDLTVSSPDEVISKTHSLKINEIDAVAYLTA